MSEVNPTAHFPYGYAPSESVCAVFVSLFGLSSLLHIGQSVYWRLWWLWPTAILSGVAETIGWSARLWSSKNPYNLAPYEMQMTTTIIAPTPLVAANFVILGHIIDALGRQYSRLTPVWYTILFCSFDLIALVIQAVGGATAALAVNNNTSPDKGGNIMLGGIVFQLVSITVYVACAAEFLFRYFWDMPIRNSTSQNKLNEPASSLEDRVLTGRLKVMIAALTFSTTCLFIRSVYRTIELENGWSGRIIHTQVYFNVLDGMMITLAIFTLNFAHPGHLLPPKPRKMNTDGSAVLEEALHDGEIDSTLVLQKL